MKNNNVLFEGYSDDYKERRNAFYKDKLVEIRDCEELLALMKKYLSWDKEKVFSLIPKKLKSPHGFEKRVSSLCDCKNTYITIYNYDIFPEDDKEYLKIYNDYYNKIEQGENLKEPE